MGSLLKTSGMLNNTSELKSETRITRKMQIKIIIYTRFQASAMKMAFTIKTSIAS